MPCWSKELDIPQEYCVWPKNFKYDLRKVSCVVMIAAAKIPLSRGSHAARHEETIRGPTNSICW